MIIVCYSRMLATMNHHNHIHEPPPSQSQLSPDVFSQGVCVPNMEDLSRTEQAGWDLNPPTGVSVLSRQVRFGKESYIHSQTRQPGIQAQVF